MFTTTKRTVAALMSAAVIGATSLVAVPAAQAESNVTYTPGVGYQEVPDQGDSPGPATGYGYYPHYRTGYQYGAPAVGAGFLFGSMLGAAVAPHHYAPPYSRTAEWCSTHYRSYSPASGTFTGFDGQQHACR